MVSNQFDELYPIGVEDGLGKRVAEDDEMLELLDEMERNGDLPHVSLEETFQLLEKDCTTDFETTVRQHLQTFTAYQIFPRGLQEYVISLYLQDADFIHGNGLNTPDIKEFDDRLRHLSCPLLRDETLKSLKNPKVKSPIEDYIETGDIDLIYTIFNPRISTHRPNIQP